jgi:hypothetical protein
MKVRELIQKLRSLDDNLEVVCWTEDEDFVGEDAPFRLFQITSIDVTHGEPTRIDGVPSMKIGKSQRSIGHVVIDITADF